MDPFFLASSSQLIGQKWKNKKNKSQTFKIKHLKLTFGCFLITNIQPKQDKHKNIDKYEEKNMNTDC